MNPLWAVGWYAGCLVVGRVVIAAVYFALLRGGHVRVNFEGRDIPTSVGAAFTLLTMLMAPCAALILGRGHYYDIAALMLLCCGFCVLGLMDDLTQTREKGGFSGHLGELGRSGRVSTALIKAFFGLVLCGAVVLLFTPARAWYELGADILLIALCANGHNLLDVKPARALKGFLAGVVLLFVISSVMMLSGGLAEIRPMTFFLIAPYALWALAYWGLDAQRKAMMGDAGSNVLGAVLALALIWEVEFNNRLIALGILVAFHIVTEIVSFSTIVEKVPPLRWLDNLGVKS